MLNGDVGVVVIAIHICADAVAIHITYIGAIIEYADAIASEVVSIVDRGSVSVIAGSTGLSGDVGVVVVTVNIGADAIVVGIAETGTGGRSAGTITIPVYCIINGGIVAIVTG